MTTIDPRTPVLIGGGQSIDRIDRPDYHGWSAADLAAAAAQDAIADSGAGDVVADQIDAIATTRTFEDSRPQPAPFGRSNNFPRSVAKRLGANPRLAVWERAGGNSPQDLLSEFAGRIAAGEFELVMLAGAEAISTVRHAQREGIVLDFREEPGGTVEDRGADLEAFFDPLARRHGVITPTLSYALAETARRARRGATRNDYAEEMGRLFAPLVAVARANPRAAWDVPSYSPSDLIAPSAQNRWIADPYPMRLVARDQVNLGAAVLLSSLGKAIELGVPRDRMVFLHGHAKATEKCLLARPDLGDSPAARTACEQAIRRAGTTVDALSAFDFYSCYPVAVSNAAMDGLGLSPRDGRNLTLTGGLPFFGGPGNNYSMHAIAEAIAAARRADGRGVLVGANGGYLSKYSVGIYSSAPRSWTVHNDAFFQAELDAAPGIALLEAFEGGATIETFTVHHECGGPSYAVAVARSDAGERLIARSRKNDYDTPAAMHEHDALGRRIAVRLVEGLNEFRLD